MAILSSVESGIKPDWADITALSNKGKRFGASGKDLKLFLGFFTVNFMMKKIL
ncbi:hypothetical protein DPMN_096469 [Dreissena polymorpha]|uniref:Uncharacterized protein n=1 Tax=Dreissena polymorpha TaxID=45954 RepID=A0A9D4LBF0_DREPO|nr:hypothetical protein DPMN_096469 [Dreissena polymorpha]